MPMRLLPILVFVVAIGLGAIWGAEAAAAESAPDPRDPQVRELIERYFRTWNAQDIERYGQCFLPQAAIQQLDPDGSLHTLGLRRFLESQRAAHRNAAGGLSETAENVDVRFEGRLARVVVFWKLVDGQRTEAGYDHFTLVPTNAGWRIANLVFYAIPPESAAP